MTHDSEVDYQWRANQREAKFIREHTEYSKRKWLGLTPEEFAAHKKKHFSRCGFQGWGKNWEPLVEKNHFPSTLKDRGWEFSSPQKSPNSGAGVRAWTWISSDYSVVVRNRTKMPKASARLIERR